MNGSAEEFEEYRPLLLGLAYRLLGSMWDAEDAVQEGFLRWMGTDRSEIREPRAFLVTVVSRIALDQLKSARVTREAYTGPWLPEPVASDAFGPLDTAELRDTLRYATLHLMERLSPPERAVFVLREAFELPTTTSPRSSTRRRPPAGKRTAGPNASSPTAATASSRRRRNTTSC